MDHYRRLGVSRSASTEEIRVAYRDRARRLHPDRGAGDERAMQELNEAWRVLREPGLRRAYDERLPGAGQRPAAAAVADDDLGDAVAFGPAGGAPLLRGLPWMIVLAVLAVIFVLTAVARSPGGTAEREVDVTPGECVTPQPGVGAPEVPCSEPNARQVVSLAGTAQTCPTGTERFEAPSLPKALCLDAPVGP